MNIQHFQGSGGDADGRIRIRMNPEVIRGDPELESAPPGAPEKEPDGSD
jgi:hypothetical protein